MSCGRPDTEVGQISWRGNCVPCGETRQIQNLDELLHRRGPFFRRWKRNLEEGLARTVASD